ncbi:LOW QUALITY PROTEIN: prominin-like protein [Drosophila subpulchrella]|uniref:LOW QUALITY PROTEIN: prominin-like protein n=1 Tax=Drosophila subpulchrella TaxID=1486046 RepID=UPI0018A1367C|nr:LOW QUALITY PROTEIN: prominin-like protein [Drosophila subpulchrella]
MSLYCLESQHWLILVDCQTNYTLRPYNVLIDQGSLINYRTFRPKNKDLESEIKSKDGQTTHVDSLGPITYVPHLFTGAVVSDSKEVPKGYISKDGDDIGSKAVKDDWAEYLATQQGLKILLPILFLLFFLVPILGLIYACCCARCKEDQKSSKNIRYCCGILLAILALLMLLFLIFAIVAATQLNKNLKSLKKPECEPSNSSKSTEEYVFQNGSDYMHQLYVVNYNQLQNFIEDAIADEPNVTESYIRGEIHAMEIEMLSDVLKNMTKVKPLMISFDKELAKAAQLATRYRQGLLRVKKDLTAFVTKTCKEKACTDFYSENQIKKIDWGCIQYHKLPQTKPLVKGVQDALASKYVTYRQKTAQQLRQISQAIRDHMSGILNTIKNSLEKGAKELQKRYEASLKMIQGVVEEMKKNQNAVVKENQGRRSTPAGTLRRKLGSSWYGTTMGIILLLMLVPILLIISLLVALSSPRVASWLLCITLIAIFILFSVGIFLLIFYLVHGALIYEAFCSRKPSQQLANRYINPNDYLPENITLSRSLPMLRTLDILHSCVRNESLYNALGLKEFYNLDGLRDDMMKDVRESLEKMENASLPHNLQYIHANATKVAQELLKGNLAKYDSKLFTRQICPELLPHPKPGSMYLFNAKLIKLSRIVKNGGSLRQLLAYVASVEKNVDRPLKQMVPQLLKTLKQLDELLTGGYVTFAKYLNYLLAKIKQGDQFLRHDAKKVTDEVARNISDFVESSLDTYVGVVDEVTKGQMGSCEHLVREEDQAKAEYTDLCNRIVKPMNAIWFWLFLFSLLLLPAICCTHFLRCRLKSLRNFSESTLVSLGGGNFVAPGMLPLSSPQCECYKYLPDTAETNVDNLEDREDFYVDHVKR